MIMANGNGTDIDRRWALWASHAQRRLNPKNQLPSWTLLRNHLGQRQCIPQELALHETNEVDAARKRSALAGAEADGLREGQRGDEDVSREVEA